MLEAILRALRLAAPGFALAVIGAIGVESGREVGRGLGKWAADRIWNKPEPKPAAKPKKPRRARARAKAKKSRAN